MNERPAETRAGHQCVWPAQRTLRAEMLARAEAQAADEALTADVRSLAGQMAILDQKLIDRSQLCRACGYPMDNSYPHPSSGSRDGRRRSVAR